jgi:hypothetical protein
VLHGLVTWGSITVLFTYLTTTPLGTALGGVFGTLGEGIVEFAQFTSEERGGPLQRLQVLLPQQRVDPEALSALGQRLASADAEGAGALMVGMGIEPERAEQLVAVAMPWFVAEPSAAAPPQETVSGWLFVALLLSLGLGVWGGMTGVHVIASREAGEHAAERQLRA